jgi:excisionase family DNA binding protein
MIIDAPDDGITPFDCVASSKVAAQLGVTRQTVNNMVHDGRLDAIRVGTTLWIRIEDVAALATSPRKRGRGKRGTRS